MLILLVVWDLAHSSPDHIISFFSTYIYGVFWFSCSAKKKCQYLVCCISCKMHNCYLHFFTNFFKVHYITIWLRALLPSVVIVFFKKKKLWMRIQAQKGRKRGKYLIAVCLTMTLVLFLWPHYPPFIGQSASVDAVFNLWCITRQHTMTFYSNASPPCHLCNLESELSHPCILVVVTFGYCGSPGHMTL